MKQAVRKAVHEQAWVRSLQSDHWLDAPDWSLEPHPVLSRSRSCSRGTQNPDSGASWADARVLTGSVNALKGAPPTVVPPGTAAIYWTLDSFPSVFPFLDSWRGRKGILRWLPCGAKMSYDPVELPRLSVTPSGKPGLPCQVLHLAYPATLKTVFALSSLPLPLFLLLSPGLLQLLCLLALFPSSFHPPFPLLSPSPSPFG